MNTKTYLLSVCGAFMLAAGLTSCHSVLDNENADNALMEFNTGLVESSTTTTSSSKVISSRADNVTATPGYVFLWPETSDTYKFENPQYKYDFDNLNAYQTTKYSTGQPYPDGGVIMNATGYSPIDGITRSLDNKTLTIGDATNGGLIDVCASNTIAGSSQAPFNETMTFDHTLTRIQFYVQSDKTMEGTWNITKVDLTLPAKYLANKWIWDSTNAIYAVDGTSTSASNNIIDWTKGIEAIGTSYLVKETYLMLNSTNAKDGKLTGLQLSVERHSAANNPQYPTPVVQTLTWNLDSELATGGIQLFEKDGVTKVTDPKPGESYIVLFTFSNNTFKLTATKNPWQQGGLITIPVNPSGN